MPWPRNVLQHVLSAHQQRTSFIGSLSRSRTSLNLTLSAANTPDPGRRRSISPTHGISRRGRLAKAQKFGSTSNLKLVTEKISGFSVFRGAEESRRQPIMAYAAPDYTNSAIGEEKRHKEESKAGRGGREAKRTPTLDYRRSGIEEETRMEERGDRDREGMKRSSSRSDLKRDVAMEAVVIDLPSLDNSCNEADGDGRSTTTHFSRWGPVRGSNSYCSRGDVPVSQLSTLDFKRALASDKSGPPDSVA